jgi:hypothetical protein
MHTQSLSSVATSVVGQYNQAGKLLVGAYRDGMQRVVNGANTRYADFLNARSLPLVTAAVKHSLINTQQQLAGFVESGFTGSANRVDQAIDLLAGGVKGGIQRLASTAQRVETAFDTTAITTAGSLSMPVAQVSLEIAHRVVKGTQRLAARVNSVGVESVEAAVVEAVEAVEVAEAAPRAVKKAVRRVKARA